MSEALPAQMSAFLNFCRIEKGLADNSIQAYSTDLSSFYRFLTASGDAPDGSATTDSLRSWIDMAPRTWEKPSDHAPLLVEF